MDRALEDTIPTFNKKEAGGGWSEANGSARPDTATAGQLNRDSAARAEGAQRTRDYSSTSSGRTGGSSSYRPSGGGGASRGGGGGRRR